MPKIAALLRHHRFTLPIGLLAIAFLTLILGYKLGSLTGGLSRNELVASNAVVGWPGLLTDPLNLPLEMIRSVVFWLAADHGQLLSRLPNAIMGGLAVLTFAGLISAWHNRRTAIITTLLFACGAWTLHVSRLASFDVQYLWAGVLLLLIDYLLSQHWRRASVWYGSLILWCLLIYVPGLVWLVIAAIYFQRHNLVSAWRNHSAWWLRALYVIVPLSTLALLIRHLLKQTSAFEHWLGLPASFPDILTLTKQVLAVPFNLFVLGPANAETWLGRRPIMDIFVLAMCVLGVYFYGRNLKARRSRLLLCFLVIGGLLVGLGGAVKLSLLVPLCYLIAGTGVAYILRDWLKVFPFNPLARGLGIGLIVIAVGLSCTYNLRSYFIAWPHSDATREVFTYQR
jgi:hypothetical protein